MAVFLHRASRPAFRRRRYVAPIRAAVLALTGLGALKAPEASGKGFATPGIESRKAFGLLAQRFPATAADGAPARTVFVAPSGERITAPANTAAGAVTAAVPIALTPAPAAVRGDSDVFRSTDRRMV
ncbi:hypothetical protein QFZ75_007315 [Streptomyces sp. V3I8]|nr:hypothetical protein [Streptomyces sp. V3I8]